MKDWYLIGNKTKPNMIGGFESDSFEDFKTDAFDEVLDSSVATTVVLYSSDLKTHKEIRCVMQENTANTKLKSTDRSILTTIGTIKAGMYVFFDNCYWLAIGYPGNNGIYEKTTLSICQYKLKWQKKNGNIVKRWANFVSASKYDVGKFSNNYISLASNNFTITIPDDDDGLTLDGKRVFIDRDIKNPAKVFEITRSDDVLYLYGEHGGVLSFIADRSELNTNKDRVDLMICDYIEPTTEEIKPEPKPDQDLIAKISGNKNLKVGLKRTYSVSFTDVNGLIQNQSFTWNIISDFNIKQEAIDNKITLLVEDEKNISSSFLLQVVVENKVLAEMKITVVPVF